MNDMSVEMSKANKEQLSHKDEEQTSSAGQGELLEIPAEEREKHSAEQVSRYRFLGYREAMEELLDDRSRQKNVFIGNGFNLALGVNTSYYSLSESLLRHATIEKLFKDEELDPELYRKIKDNPQETEQLICGICDHYHKAFVKEIFYDRILYRARSKYNQKAVAQFLKPFDMYFTINYDPLLYLILLSMGGEKPEKNSFYRRIKRIYCGEVKAQEEKTGTPLEDFTPRQLYDISTHIMKGDLPPHKRDLVFRIIRDIRKEKFITFRDGFTGPKGKDQWWRPSLKLGKGDVDLFYLHGSTFFYEEGRAIKKRVSDKRRGFITMLAEEGSPMCVFEADKQDKLDKINNNGYLSYCRDELRTIKDDLCIVGWSCQDCDDHLVACINENKNLTRMFVSCYGKEKNEMSGTAKRYADKFEDKEIVFWDVSTAPFCKKE